MRFTIQQKYFTMRDAYTITDEYGNPVYKIKGKIISLAKKLYLYDANGNEIFLIKSRLFRLFARFDFIQNGNTVTYIKRRPSLFCPRFKIDTPVGQWKVKGAWHGFSFRVVDENDNELGIISKKLLKIADTYTVDVPDPRNATMIMAIALVMDALYHRRH